MANHKSAMKANRINVNLRAHNREFRNRMRRALRSIRRAIDNGEGTQANEALRNTVSLIDKLVSKGIVHANTAARHKSRLAKRLAKMSVPS